MGYNPSYKWINPTYPIYNWGYTLTHLLSGMSHQVRNVKYFTQYIAVEIYGAIYQLHIVMHVSDLYISIYV